MVWVPHHGNCLFLVPEQQNLHDWVDLHVENNLTNSGICGLLCLAYPKSCAQTNIGFTPFELR